MPCKAQGEAGSQPAYSRLFAKACKLYVPRADKKPGCFALLTTLPAGVFDSAALLEAAYLPRGGAIENIFRQLDQAFEITHLRCRRFYGNWTFLMLALIAATLTQMLRQEAIVRQEPIPAGLQETLTAAADSGLRFKHDATAGRILIETITGAYTKTFKKLIRCSRQHRFKFAA